MEELLEELLDELVLYNEIMIHREDWVLFPLAAGTPNWWARMLNGSGKGDPDTVKIVKVYYESLQSAFIVQLTTIPYPRRPEPDLNDYYRWWSTWNDFEEKS